jgi:hypothetical protein
VSLVQTASQSIVFALYRFVARTLPLVRLCDRHLTEMTSPSERAYFTWTRSKRTPSRHSTMSKSQSSP